MRWVLEGPGVRRPRLPENTEALPTRNVEEPEHIPAAMDIDQSRCICSSILREIDVQIAVGMRTSIVDIACLCRTIRSVSVFSCASVALDTVHREAKTLGSIQTAAPKAKAPVRTTARRTRRILATAPRLSQPSIIAKIASTTAAATRSTRADRFAWPEHAA